MVFFHNPRSRRLVLSSASALTLAFAISAPLSASAQVAAAPAEGEKEVETVVVTATRVQRDGYEAPTPTTVVGAADIAKAAPGNIAEYINQLPQVGSASFASARSAGFVANSANSANAINLRGLGLDRTLTLLDGRRVVNSGTQNVVDVNMLPTNLVSRVDIVTGGASAAWGSDAVAGVINFVLDKGFTGLKGSVSGGQSWLGDAGSFTADLAMGSEFAGGRGHVLLSARYEDGDGIARADSRSWFSGHKAVRNRAFTPTNGQPGFLALDNAGIAVATSGGVAFGLTGTPLGYQFGPGGAVQAWFPATQGSGAIGAGGSVEDVAGGYTLLADVDNQQVFGRVSYDLTDRINVYAELGLGWARGENTTSHAMLFSKPANTIIRNDNAYLPAGLTFAGPPGTPAFILFKIFNEPGLAPVRNYSKRQQTRFVAGIDGENGLFNDSFRWSAYYQRGETKVFTENANNPYWANLVRALDAVRNPATGGVPGVAAGVPVCRSTITAPTNGCQPLNFFGVGSPSREALNYILGSSYKTDVIQQDVAALSFQMEPFSLPAGPVSLALGGEYRKEALVTTVSDRDNEPGNPEPFYFGNFRPVQGEFDVREAFAEVVLPIVKDVPLAKALDFNGAVRVTDYSTSGMVTTWKVGGTWDLTEDLRFRATRSRDIRAPNLGELYRAGGGFATGVSVPGSGRSVTISALPIGNLTLVPEIAKTFSVGAVYRPSWLPGFSASVDYYKINVRKEIRTLNAQQAVNLCYGGNNDAFACSLITVNPAPLRPGLDGQLDGAIIRRVDANQGDRDLSGVDIEASYRRDLADVFESLPGSFEVRAVGNYLDTFTATYFGVTTDYKGMVFAGTGPAVGPELASSPEWRWYLSGTYNLGSSSTTLTVRYIGEAVVNNEPLGNRNHVDQNDIPSVTYLDLIQTWNVEVAGAEGQVFAKIENLFDKDPPRVPSTAGTSWASSGSDASYYDLIGRYWRVGFRFKY